jgi:hypothetical protein
MFLEKLLLKKQLIEPFRNKIIKTDSYQLMITIYLDHQIYSYLKNKDNSTFFQGPTGSQKMETIRKLHEFLTDQKGNFLIFYSHAHLLDLSSDKSGNKERLLEDLRYREKWAEDNYLIFEEKDNSTDYKFAFPEKQFEPYWVEQEEMNFSNLFDFSDFDEHLDIDKLDELKQHKATLENLRFPNLDDLVPEETKQNEDYHKLKDMFGFMDGGSFMDILKGFTDFSKRFQDEKGVYKGMRGVVTSGIQKARSESIPVNTPETKFIVDLANTDLNSPEKESFVKENLLVLVKKQWTDRNKGKDTEPTSFDLHYQSYLMLDMMGIEMEKATIARNMLHDAQHSFYGGNCEIVVSDDKQFRAKSKLLYQLFGLSTQVLSIEEFMKQSFSLELENVNSSSDLLLRTKHDLNTGFISTSRVTAMFNHVSELKPSMKYLHYFNQILIVNEGGRDYIVFRHKTQTYLKHLPYRVIEGITNKTFQLFGLDVEGKSMYKWETENEEIRAGKWLGRTWSLNHTSITLQISPDGRNLQLVLG